MANKHSKQNKGGPTTTNTQPKRSENNPKINKELKEVMVFFY